MIVKDAEKYIEQCIAAVYPVISEIIIVDTGCTDNTIELIRRFNPKIYHHTWNNNFADARNMSIEHATCDYILVLDADEIIYPEDLPKIADLINKTDADGVSIVFHNLTNEANEDAYNTHLGLRIFRNGSFRYEGAIHEQPIFQRDGKPALRTSNIRVKHYGYLASNAGEKKHARNLAILQEVLAKDPDNSFHLFNLGNEYMSIGRCDEALQYYEKSKQNIDLSLAYAPHLLYRMASCLHNLKRNEEALAILTEGLGYYAQCTDYEYLRGLILTKMKRFTLALDSFNRCIEMGKAPATLSFFDETSDFRPLIEMGRIYVYMDDYKRALDCYLKAVRMGDKKHYVIYQIGKMLNRIYADKDVVYQNLCNLFADSSYKYNVFVTTDVLFDENLLAQAKTAFGRLDEATISSNVDALFLRGRLEFAAHAYEKAYEWFAKSIQPGLPRGILPDRGRRTREYMAACALLCDTLRTPFTTFANGMADCDDKAAYLSFMQASDAPLPPTSLDAIARVLSRLLYVREYEVFERALYILNQVDSDEVLLALADLYFQNDFHDMAVKTILRSVKELDAINANAVFILNREFILH